jgi:hypothetical protein
MTVPSHIADILTRLGRIEGKIDSYNTAVATQKKDHDDLEVRTRKVENRQHWYSGAGAVLGAILGAVGVHVKTQI